MKVQKKQQGNTLTLSITGRIDALTAPKLQSEIDFSDVQNIIFDLKKVDYISSAGLRVFLETLKEVNFKHKSMKILNLQPLVREIFYETSFDKIFDIGK